MQGQSQMTAADAINEVRMRYRICNYLFTTGALWVLAGYLGVILTPGAGQDVGLICGAIAAVGAGIFTCAFALTLAIYRCPACDKYLSRFRPDKTKCPRYGIQVRLISSGRP
jgi:energy-converting hydrogenase Eha subunit E